MIRVYLFDDYRDFLREAADERKIIRPNFKYADFAKAISVQPTYLSRVFRKDAHLNTDQLYVACEELEVSREESTFLFLLLEYQKSSLKKRQEALKKQIVSIRTEKLNTKNYLNSAEVVGVDRELLMVEYYLEPLAPIIHLFLHIPEFQKQPEHICKFLGCSTQRLKKILSNLEKLKMIQYISSEKRYMAFKSLLHLDKNSTLNQAYQLLTRNLCNEHLKKLGQEDKHQYSVTITADHPTMEAIYSEFNNFIKQVETLVTKAKNEGVFQLNFDLFRWDAPGE